MRVLHLVKTSVGAPWAVRLTRELVRSGIEIHVALPPGGPRAADYRDVGVVVHEVDVDFPASRPFEIAARLRDLRNLVDAVHPDVIHSHFVGPTLTMRLALGRRHPVPRIFEVPGPLHLEHPFFRELEIRLAGPNDFWIGTCRKTCAIYRSWGISGDRLFLSYYGVDVAEVPRQRSRTLRGEIGLDEHDVLVGMVAYMYPPKRFLGQTRGLKGHEDFIDAVALVAKERPDVTAVCIGGGWDGAVGYERRIRRYGERQCGDRLRFLGTRNDVPDLYPDIDVAVHPSHSENVGGAAESLLHAIPTIATDVGGFRDVVLPGETGWLVPARDARSLADAILDALRDPIEARRRAERGREKVCTLLDVRRNATEVASAYRAVVGRSAEDPRAA